MEKIDLKIRNVETFSAFKKSISKFIRPSSNSIFNCHSPNGIKLMIPKSQTCLYLVFLQIMMHQTHVTHQTHQTPFKLFIL